LEEEKLQPIPKPNNVVREMHTIAEGLKSGSKLTVISNAVIHSICDDAPCLATNFLPASC
jgi:hypothetical protein